MTKIRIIVVAPLLLLPACWDKSKQEPRVERSHSLTPAAKASMSPEARLTPETPADPRSQRHIWAGPDEAVQSFYSTTCQKEILTYGQQNYYPGESKGSVPNGVTFLGYRLENQQLWGDRGSPASLYVTVDGGRTFREWLATTDQC